jgi:hypothetical protein
MNEDLMKRILTVVLLALVCTALASTALAQNEPAHHSHHKSVPRTCTVQGFRGFSKVVWRLKNWDRGKPSASALNAYQKRLGCAPAKHAKAIKATWHRDQNAYFAHRDDMLWLEKYKPEIYPDGSRWAVPYPIALCESGGDYYVGPSGAYGLIPPFPQYMSPKAQDEVARNLYLEQGEYQPWVKWESECAYR